MKHSHKSTLRSSLVLGLLATLAPAFGHAETTGAQAPSTPPAAEAQDKTQGKIQGKVEDKSKASAETTVSKSMEQRHDGDEAAFFSARLAALHAGLVLEADQEALWPPVEAAIRGLAKTTGHPHDRRAIRDLMQMSPIELLQLRSERLIERGEAIAALIKATEPLLSGLDEAQKSRLPDLLAGLRPSIVLRAAFGFRDGEDRRDDRDRAGRWHREDDRDDHADRRDRHRRDEDAERGPDRMGPGRMEQDRMEQDRTGPGRMDQGRMGHDHIDQDRGRDEPHMSRDRDHDDEDRT